MKFVLYLYLFVIPFYPSLSVFSIFGFPIISLYNLSLLAFLIVKSVLQKNFYISQLLLALTVVVSLAFSIALGWDVTKCLTNISLYAIPVLIYVLVRETKINIDCFASIMTLSLTISAILSILALLGILTKTSNYYINIYYVDGGAGIVGIILCFYRLFSAKKKCNLFQTIILGIAGLVVVLLGQSRARIIIAVLAVAMICLLLFCTKDRTKKNNIHKIIPSVLFFAVIVFIAYHLVPSFSFYVNNIISRIHTLGLNDENVTSRLSEASFYVDLFKSNPVLGVGWGFLYNSSYLTPELDQYYAHNMFAGLLAAGGLLFCIPYFSFLVVQLNELIRGIVKYRSDFIIPGLVAFVCLIALSITSSGFGKMSCTLFITMVFITNYELKQMEKATANKGKTYLVCSK